MKLTFPEIQNVFSIKPDTVNSLVIENPKLLYSLVNDIRLQINKQSGDVIISENEKPVDINKSVELLTDVYGMDFHSRNIMTKIIDELSEKAMEPDNYEKSMKLMGEIETYVNELIWDMDCEVVFPIVYPKQILKAINLTIEEQSTELSERIFEYIELVNHFLGEKLFIFVNFRGYLQEEKFNLLAETLIEHGIRNLFIDNKSYDLLENENRWTVDIDLCEF